MTSNNPDTIWQKINEGVFIIAEAGKNFIQTEDDRPVVEYLTNAKQLVDLAVEAGADAIKWQTHNVEDEQLDIQAVSPHFKGSDRYSWLTRNTKATPLKDFWRPLKAYCDERGIIFFSTPMSRGAAKILSQVGVDLWKVGSGDILDFVLLDYLRQQGQPIIISSGMSTLEEVMLSVNFLKEKNSQVALMHCVSQYPCPPEELCLGTIETFRRDFSMPIGFSDHSIEGLEQDLLAAALGATIIEKHFSLSRDLWGADHKVSLLPKEFKALVGGVRKLERNEEEKKKMISGDYAQKVLASKSKKLQESEAVFRPLFRKSLVAGSSISAGTVLTPDLIYAMRPQAHVGGLPSERYADVLGKKTKVNFKKYDPITWDVLS